MSRDTCGVILSIAALFLAPGCARNSSRTEQLLDSLADTVYAGEEREVVLTTGTGCYFYADALSNPRKSNYGFYRISKRIIVDWVVSDEAGRAMNEQADYAVLHPDYVMRHYPGGVDELVECIPECDALAVTYTFEHRIATWLGIYSQDDGAAPKFAVSSNCGAGERLKSTGRVVSYSQATLMGLPSPLRLHSESELSMPPAGKWTIVIQATASEDRPANYSAEDLAGKPERWRKLRHAKSLVALDGFEFYCQDRRVERSVAWARIMLQNLYYHCPSEARLLTGIPESPEMDCFHSSLACPGFDLSDETHSRAASFFQTLIGHQNLNAGTPGYGRFPTAIYEDSAAYASVVPAGMAAITFDRVVAGSDSVPLGLPTQFVQALEKAIAAELDAPGLVMGFLATPGLFNTIGFPPEPRKGAAIETQALFSAARRLVYGHLSGGFIKLDIPAEVLLGTSDWTYPYIAPVAVSESQRQYRIPLSLETIMTRLKSLDGVWYDRLILPDSMPTSLPAKYLQTALADTTQTAAIFLAVACLEPGDRRTAEKLLARSAQCRLLGETGVRSLAATEPDFQSSHVFVYDGRPVRAELAGDVLVWSSGVLADLYRLTEMDGDLHELFENLTKLVMEQGVMGGLPETVDGMPGPGHDNTGRNPIFASSLAEYLRILHDDILGIESKRPAYPGVRLSVPPSWGSVEFSFEAAGSTILIKRLDPTTWIAEQHGSNDPVSLSVELIPGPGMRAYGSLRLEPKMVTKLSAVPTGIGRWTLGQNEYLRE